MTVPRDPGGVDAAVLKALRLLSPDDVRQATGYPPHHLHRVTNPHTDRKLHVETAVALEALLMARGHAPLFLPIIEAELQTAVARLGGAAPRPAVSPMVALCRVTTELGRLSQTVEQALADGQVSPGERRAIAETTHELIDRARMMLEAIEPPRPAVAPLRSA